MKIYFAAWLTDRSLGDSLTKKGAKTRLLSFYFLREQNITDEMIAEYSQTGKCDPRKNK
jgi:hypothetical protein